MKKVFITGSTGFIGSNLIKFLLTRYDEVHALVRQDSNLINQNAENLHIHYYDGSISSIINSLRKSKPDIVFHLASLFISEHKSEDIPSLINTNVLFPTQLLEAMSIAGVRNVINTGTSWQHYKSSSYDPVNLYAASKQAFEAILQYYINAHSFRAITLKLYDTYGKNDKRLKLINILKKASDSRNVLCMSPGEQLIDLVHVDDVVNAYAIAAERLLDDSNVSCEEYKISSGNAQTLKSIVNIYCQVTNKKININWGGRKYRDREVMQPCHPGAPLPNWRPKISLYKGFESIDDEVE